MSKRIEPTEDPGIGDDIKIFGSASSPLGKVTDNDDTATVTKIFEQLIDCRVQEIFHAVALI